MNCPACKAAMVEKDFGGVMIDVCRSGCKSLWFDYGELKKLDETHEGLGDALKEGLNSPRVKDDQRNKLNCPKCNSPMMAHLYQSAKEVTVDECYACGGFFLDAGELKVVRDNFMNEEQRKKYRDDILKEHPVSKEMEKIAEREEARTEAAEKLTKLLGTNMLRKIFYRERYI